MVKLPWTVKTNLWNPISSICVWWAKFYNRTRSFKIYELASKKLWIFQFILRVFEVRYKNFPITADPILFYLRFLLIIRLIFTYSLGYIYTSRRASFSEKVNIIVLFYCNQVKIQYYIFQFYYCQYMYIMHLWEFFLHISIYEVCYVLMKYE